MATFRGKRACLCQVDFLTDFERFVFKRRDYYYQLIGGASASAGTHATGGCDDTPTKTSAHSLASRRMGGWSSNRYTWQGFDMNHNHRVIFGCPHLSSGARYQESELRAGRNGLAGRARDTFSRPSKIVTYRQWKAARIAAANASASLVIMGKKYPPISTVSVYWINMARAAKTFSRHVYFTQVWLRKLGFYMSTLDGRWGKVTQGALDNFRRKYLRWSAADSAGSIGLDSLTRLRNATGSTRKVRNGR